ncbi:MAG: prolipoprotein diacylglyceryl transferase [Polyangiales bacterium]
MERREREPVETWPVEHAWRALVARAPDATLRVGGLPLIFALGVLLVQPRKRFDGQVMLFFLAGYAVLRFVLEWLRDDDRGAVAGLTTSQWIGVAMMALVVWAWPKLARAARASS